MKTKSDWLEYLGFYLEKQDDVWMVIDQIGESRTATMPERVLWDALMEALSEVQALSAAPAGWKLVPEDATEEMVRATDKVNFANADTDGTMHNVWNVMLAATPTPPAEQQAEESYVKLLADCRDAFPIPEPGGPLEVQWSAAMARPEEVPEYVRLCVAEMQAAHKAAPGEPDRGDATNLARNAIKYPDLQLTAKGVRCLAYAVLEMDKYIAKAPQQEAQEPVAWQSRTRPTWGGNTRPWSLWEPCTKGQAEDCWKTPLLHDWAYEARALFTAPQQEPASTIHIGWGRDYLDNGKPIDASAAPVPNLAAILQQDATVAAFEAVRKKLCTLPRYSFVLDDGGLVRRAPDRTGNWIEFDEAHALFDPVSMDAARKQGVNHD